MALLTRLKQCQTAHVVMVLMIVFIESICKQ